MSAAELLVELGPQGFTLTPAGDGIRVTPAGRLTAELRDRIRRHRPELLLLLSPLSPAPAGPEVTRADLSPERWGYGARGRPS